MNLPIIGDFKVGTIVTGSTGKRWKVVCTNNAGTVGLRPVGLFHRLYWWLKLNGLL